MIFSIDCGGSGIKYGILNDDLEILEKGSVKCEATNTQEFVDFIGKVYKDFGKGAEAVAISYCGELDPENGYLYSGGSYYYNNGATIKPMLEKVIPVPLTIENDGNCALLAEVHSGALKGCRNAISLVLGTGVAGGLFLDGKVYRGNHFFAGAASFAFDDIGKGFSLDNIAATTLGYVGLTNPYSFIKFRPEHPVTGKEFFEDYDAGDPLAAMVLDNFCEPLGRFIYNIQSLLDVEKIAIGGGISQNPALIKALRPKVEESFAPLNSMGFMIKAPEIEACHYSADANLIGAAYHYQLSNK